MRQRHAAAGAETPAVLPLAAATALAERDSLRPAAAILSRRSLKYTACGMPDGDTLRAQLGIHCGRSPQLTALAERDKLRLCAVSA